MTTTNQPIVIDTPDGIAMARLLVLRSALKLEVEHPGMKASRIPTLPAARQILGEDFRTKKAALARCNEILAPFDAERGV